MSFAGTFQDAIIPTLMLWTSTECWETSKSAIVKILPCLRRYQSWTARDNVSKRERNLTLAKEALLWRRQQVSLANNLPQTDLLQGLGTDTISSLKTTQLESNTTGARRRSPVSSVHHQSKEAILPAKIVHVKSAVETNQKSEILLKCASLKLMDNSNDPVKKINSFTVSDL